MDKIHESWNELFTKYNFDLDNLYNTNNIIYPKKDQVFRVFEMDVSEIKILLLGQDPYHNPDQANGLSFSASTQNNSVSASIFLHLLKWNVVPVTYKRSLVMLFHVRLISRMI